MAAVGTTLKEFLTADINSFLLCGVLATFQIVFPALIFPLFLIFIDVSIYNHFAADEATKHFNGVVKHLKQILPLKIDGHSELLRKLGDDHHVSLTDIWHLRLWLFCYGSLLGLLLPFIIYGLGCWMRMPEAYHSYLARCVAFLGFLFSLTLLWWTHEGIRKAKEVREQTPRERRRPKLLHPWDI